MDADPNEPNDIAAEMNRLVDELRRHQTEVTMQNEELRTTIADLEAAKARLAALYDDAPVGYCTLDEQRIVIKANLSLARMLGVLAGTTARQAVRALRSRRGPGRVVPLPANARRSRPTLVRAAARRSVGRAAVGARRLHRRGCR